MKKLLVILLLVADHSRHTECTLMIKNSGNILCVGDSTVYGLNVDINDAVSFTEFVPNSVKFAYPGWSTNRILSYLHIVPFKPDYLVIRELTCDAFMAANSPETYKENLIKLANYYDDSVTVIFLDYPLVGDKYQEYQAVLKEAAIETNSIYLETYCEGYFNQVDHTHPTKLGAKNIARVLNETIDKLERAKNSGQSKTNPS